MRRLFLFLLPILFTLSSGPSATAADIRILDLTLTNEAAIREGKCAVSLSGQITSGDVRKLESIFPKFMEEQDYGSSLCLNSPGGSLKEAIRMAHVFRGLMVVTIVPEGATCLSACAVAFMGGTVLPAGTPKNARYIHKSAKLGFHAPALLVEDGNYSKEVVVSAFRAAVSAIGRLAVDLGETLSGQPIAKFPYSLLGEMLSYHGNDFLYVDVVEFAGAWDIGIIGAEEIPTTDKALNNFCWSAFRWFTDRPETDRDFLDKTFSQPPPSEVTESSLNRWVVENPSFKARCEIRQLEEGKVSVDLEIDGNSVGTDVFDSWAGRLPNTKIIDL